MARPTDQALVSDQAAERLDPSGFDPSRAWRTDKPPFDLWPIYQFVLLEGFQEHSGHTWHRQWAGTATISNGPGNRFGYRGEDIDRIQRDGDMICVTKVLGWVPATWPRWDWFTPSDSDRSGEAVETTGSTEGESGGPQDIAQTPVPGDPQ